MKLFTALLLAAGLAAPAAAAEAPARSGWTIMAYLNADADLAQIGPVLLEGLEKAGSSEGVEIVAELAVAGSSPRRLHINRRGGEPGSEFLEKAEGADMGDWRHMADFIMWAKRRYPAKHYLFFSFGHGIGWIDPTDTGMNAVFNWDKPRGGSKATMITAKPSGGYSYISTPQLADVFRLAGPVDVYFTFSCLMQMAETVYEMRDYAKVFVGSEEVIAVNRGLIGGYMAGMERVTKGLSSSPETPAERVAAVLVNSLRETLTGYAAYPVSFSVLRAKELSGLPARAAAFAAAVRGNNERAAAAYAIANVVRMVPVYGSDRRNSSYADLYDLARLVGEKAEKEETRAAARELMGYISGRLVSANASFGGAGGYFARARGIAVEMTPLARPADAQMLPSGYDAEMTTDYAGLSFVKASGWGDFLAWTAAVWKEAGAK